MNKRVLVIASHPDDELLGCGGTIIRHTDEGDEVQNIIMCEGESLRYKNAEISQSEATRDAAAIMNTSKTICLGFPDQNLDKYTLVDLITPIEEVINEYKPEIVYIQNGGDINCDHQITFEAASVALRPVAQSVSEIYTFYTVGSTEWAYPVMFKPCKWVNIENQLERKIQAFLCYSSEVREYPHPRSEQALRILAAYVGNQCCMCAAESFEVIRQIVR